LNKSTLVLKEQRTSFFMSIKKEEKLDDQTFNIWKNELLKELPDFWESMSESRKRSH